MKTTTLCYSATAVAYATDYITTDRVDMGNVGYKGLISESGKNRTLSKLRGCGVRFPLR